MNGQGLESCRCQGCGYEYVMPDMGRFREIGLGTFDIASWVYCTPECLSHDTWPDEHPPLNFWRRAIRPLFRWRERRRYTKLLTGVV